MRRTIMDTSARISVLQRVPLFAGLPAEALGRIAGTALEVRVAKNDSPFRQGDPATHGHVVGWGRIRLDQATADGQNVVLRYMGPGDMLGTVAVLRGIPYPATAVAVEDSLLLAWSAPRLSELFNAYPALALNAIRLVGTRLEELQQRLQEVATQRVERRIAGTLLRLVRQGGRRGEQGIEIPFSMSRQDLAELTATTLHTVSRTLSAWEQQGIISARRSSHLVILQPHRLVAIAEEA
ncbi:MAG TPA: Crp/Fnr family transcriptional regulator [Kiloniellales bacterium]|nr:Crp/Fnr family transcriptional regulator [Kiloniellales bacterium]